MRKMQSNEYSDISEAGRKVDCLFIFDGIEISNIVFKSPEICEKGLAIQNCKNIRLARCIQESHIGIGFSGIFYQVKPMGDIAIARKTTSTVVQIPRTAEIVMQSSLEKQGPNLVRAKERFDAAQAA
ncbi:hypothetical protein BGZ76_007273, partial [Entomortierella beljakovae]